MILAHGVAPILSVMCFISLSSVPITRLICRCSSLFHMVPCFHPSWLPVFRPQCLRCLALLPSPPFVPSSSPCHLDCGSSLELQRCEPHHACHEHSRLVKPAAVAFLLTVTPPVFHPLSHLCSFLASLQVRGVSLLAQGCDGQRNLVLPDPHDASCPCPPNLSCSSFPPDLCCAASLLPSICIPLPLRPGL